MCIDFIFDFRRSWMIRKLCRLFRAFSTGHPRTVKSKVSSARLNCFDDFYSFKTDISALWDVQYLIKRFYIKSSSLELEETVLNWLHQLARPSQEESKRKPPLGKDWIQLVYDTAMLSKVSDVNLACFPTWVKSGGNKCNFLPLDKLRTIQFLHWFLLMVLGQPLY